MLYVIKHRVKGYLSQKGSYNNHRFSRELQHALVYKDTKNVIRSLCKRNSYQESDFKSIKVQISIL